MFPKVSIIILNWNGKEDTIECLESLKNITYPNYEILIVDNGSTDGSTEFFEKKYPSIEIIKNQENLGFAEGNNVGVYKVIERGTEYLLLLNNDTIVDPEFLTELVVVAESNERIGIVGPMIYFYDKKDVIQSFGSKFIKFTGKIYTYGCGLQDKGQFNKTEEKELITGCVMLINKEVIEKIGCFDPVYFAYWEDVDLCTRTLKSNYKIVVTPKSKVWHKGSKSTGGYMNKNAYYYHVRNSIYYYYKNRPKLYAIYIVYLLSIYFISLIGFSIIKNKFDLLESFIKGIRDSVAIIK